MFNIEGTWAKLDCSKKRLTENAARYVYLEVIEGPSYRILWNHHTLKLFSLEGIFIPKQAALQDKVWCLSIRWSKTWPLGKTQCYNATH